MNEKIVESLTQLAIDNPGVKNQFKLAAGIVYKNTLVATGVNSHKTHPMMAQWGRNKNSICLHAEIDAIKNALKSGLSLDTLAKCDIYVVRVKRPQPFTDTWIHGLAKPCKGCMRAIVNFDLNNLYYTEEVSENQ